MSVGDENVELLCQHINREWMDSEQIIKEFKIFKKRAYKLVESGDLQKSFENNKKSINRKWRREYEIIRLFDTQPNLYNSIHLFWNFFSFFYVQGMSETDCESAYSTIKYSTERRPNLTNTRVSNISIIRKNGPKTGDEDPFLRQTSKKFLMKYNAPLATQSKFLVSRALESQMKKISSLDFRTI